MTKLTVLSLFVLLVIVFLCTESSAKSDEEDENDVAVVPSCCGFSSPLLIKKDQWKPIFETKFGQISTVQIGDGCGGMGPYKIHSITLEPNALLLPLLLHSDMVFFVDSGSGNLSWVEEEATSSEIRRGDVYRLRPGTVFYLQNKPVDILLGTKLRVYAIFSNTEDCLHDSCFGVYSSITDLLFGFDETILQSAFGVPEEIIGLMRNRTQPPLIVHDTVSTPCEANTNKWQLQPRLLKLFTGDVSVDSVMGPEDNKKKKEKEKKKKAKTFNVFESEPDFESPNGRSITINKKDLQALKGSMVGVSMVNLTQGSMRGPLWNPWACEISVVLKGSGMVRVLRSSISRSSSECKNMRFRVEEGDIFAVPRLHPMAQMSFINESFVFIGFTTSAKNNEPQLLAGKSSALRLLDQEVLAASFNESSGMIDVLLGAQEDQAVMLGCPSCAEGELEKLKVEMEMKKRDDERKKEEEEAKKEEEERRKREEKEEEEEKKHWPPQPRPQPQPEPQPHPHPQPHPRPRPQPQPSPSPSPSPSLSPILSPSHSHGPSPSHGHSHRKKNRNHRLRRRGEKKRGRENKRRRGKKKKRGGNKKKKKRRSGGRPSLSG